MEHKTCSIGIQCDLLAAAPLKKLTSTSNDNKEADHNTRDAAWDADRNTEDADLDTSYQLSQEDTTTE